MTWLRRLRASLSAFLRSPRGAGLGEERHDVERALRRSQETLRGERDRVHAYLDLVEVMIVALDRAGSITLINRKGCRLLGYSEEELIGRNWFETCLPGEIAAATQDVFQWLMGGQLSSFEYYENPVVTKAGTERLISWHNALLRDGQGQITGSLSAGEDITEQRQSEDQLRRQASQLAALRRIGLDLATELDLDALLHSIVEQAITLVGGPAGGMYLYRPAEDVLEWHVAIGPGLVQPGAKLRRGEGVSGKAWERDETLIVDDYKNWPGKAPIYAGLTWASVLAVPVRWREEFLGIIDVLADEPNAFSAADAELLELFASQAAVALQNARLFEQERQQRSVAQALARASAAVSSSLDVNQVMDRILEQVGLVVPCDAANIMLYQDNAFRVVCSRGYECFGMAEFVSRVDFAAELVPNLLELVESGQPLLIPDTRQYPGWYEVPEQAWLRSYAAAPIQVQGRAIGVLNVDSSIPGHFTAQHLQHLEAFAAQAAVAVQNARLYEEIRDYAEQLEMRVVERTFELQQRVSEVEQLNQAMLNLLEDLSRANQLATENARKLQAANAELEAFAYSVSHDLRAPLRAIIGFSEIIQRRHAANLGDEGRHYLGNIVKASEQMSALIDDLLAYARLGRRAVHRQPVSLAEVFSRVLQNLQPRTSEAAAELSIPDELPVVWGDGALLGQIFGNLLDNALLYRRPGVPCRIVVEARPDEEQVFVSVADNGIGIAREHHDKVFKMFQRLHGDDLYQGTGIGLAIVKKAVDLLDGEITLESTEGQGSTFSVRLPAA